MFYSVGIFKPGKQHLKWPSRELLQGVNGEARLNRSLQQKGGSLNIISILWIKENQISQVKEFSTFLCMGRCKSLGSLKSFLSYASQLSGARVLCFHILSSSMLTIGSGCSPMVMRSCRYSPPSWMPWGLRSLQWKARFTDDCEIPVYNVAGNIPFLSSDFPYRSSACEEQLSVQGILNKGHRSSGTGKSH